MFSVHLSWPIPTTTTLPPDATASIAVCRHAVGSVQAGSSQLRVCWVYMLGVDRGAAKPVERRADDTGGFDGAK